MSYQEVLFEKDKDEIELRVDEVSILKDLYLRIRSLEDKPSRGYAREYLKAIQTLDDEFDKSSEYAKLQFSIWKDENGYE